jgi:beta-galactosidase
MYFGADYYPEQWVFPYGGTSENPEAQWEQDAELMAKSGINVVRVGEFVWGLCEPRDGEFNFDWLRRFMDLMGRNGIQVVLATPTAAPPVWLSKKFPEILPLDENGIPLRSGARRAVCFNSDVYWNYSKRIVEAMADALGRHPQLIAWQIDSGIGGHQTEWSFNEGTRLEWQNWLKLKYETVERLNRQLGLYYLGQVVSSFDDVPMPMRAPTPHNPALMLDWARFSSDTVVAFINMQAEALRALTPDMPITTNLRAFQRRFDHFDVGKILDFVSMESNAVARTKAAELACEIDLIRSLKKEDIQTPDGDTGFWAIEQKLGQSGWQDANALLRPGLVRLITYQLLSRGASAILYYQWRQPRIGNEKFSSSILPHHVDANSRVLKEITQLSEEIRMLAPAIKGTKVVAETCILYTHDNDWALQQPMQPSNRFNLREHIQLFYNALHERNISVDFARPTDDLSRYKIVFAPSLHLLSGGEADLLNLYVQNGGNLVATFNTGLVDEHNMAAETGYPHDMTDLFGLEVLEFEPLSEGEENHLTFKGAFPTSHLHPARLWCDIIEPKECQVLATYAKDFYAGRAAMTMNVYGLGKAIYIGTQSHQPFYHDLVVWLRQVCNLHPLLKVPENIQVSMRQKDGAQIYFLLNHQNSPVRVQFYKPMHDFLTGNTFSGNYDLPPHGVLVLDEHVALEHKLQPTE